MIIDNREGREEREGILSRSFLLMSKIIMVTNRQPIDIKAGGPGYLWK
ncbi:hypothetical protein OH491_22495 [Termitidicoccus mucosus]